VRVAYLWVPDFAAARVASTLAGVSGDSRRRARITKRLDAVEDSTTLPENEPWERLARLAGLSALSIGRTYEQRFGRRLDKASDQPREEPISTGATGVRFRPALTGRASSLPGARE
jgi:hypothetical protein